MITEIKIGNFYYFKDPKSGFWIDPNAQIPQDATMTAGELSSILQDNINKGEDLIMKFKDRIQQLKDAVEELAKDV